MSWWGELRELNGRVVALEIRDEDKNLIARAEGEFGELESSESGEWSFQLGGTAPRKRGGIRFISASWTAITIDPRRVLDARDTATGFGATLVLRIRLAGGTSITLWPAMPPADQWTELHEDTR